MTDPAKRVFGAKDCGCCGNAGDEILGAAVGVDDAAILWLIQALLAFGISRFVYRFSDAISPVLAQKLQAIVDAGGNLFEAVNEQLHSNEIAEITRAHDLAAQRGMLPVQDQSRVVGDVTTGVAPSLIQTNERLFMANPIAGMMGAQTSSIPQYDGDSVPIYGVDDIVNGLFIDRDARGLSAIMEVVNKAITLKPRRDLCKLICALQRGLIEKYGMNELTKPKVPAAQHMADPTLSFATWDIHDQWLYLVSRATAFGCNCDAGEPATA